MKSKSCLHGLAIAAVLVAAGYATGQERAGARTQELGKALSAAKVTLSQAIEAAQKEVAGGKVVEAGLEMEKDATFYEVVLLSADAVKEVKVDAATGKVLGVKDEKPDEDEAKELADTEKALGAAKLTFAQALETAAKEVKDGRPFKAELELKDGQSVYRVALLQGDKVMTAALDAASGKVLKVAEWQRRGEGEKASAKDKEMAEAKKALAAAKVTMVQALETALKEGKGAKPFKIDLEMEEGKAIYDVELLEGDKAQGPEMEIDAVTGRVNKVETVEEQAKEDAKEAKEHAAKSSEEQREEKQKATGAKAMPLAKITITQAVQAAEKEVKDGQAYSAILEIEDGKPQYDVKVMTGDTWKEVEVDAASGKVLKVEDVEEEEGEEEGEHEDQPATKTAESGEWRQDFKVDKGNWADHGMNPYFILEPGYRWHYKHGNTTLTITILDETKVVDGVTTRVLEEREERDGKPLEISRNYFAIDKATGDVYYFGEDVDEYKDGKVAGHEGAWLSGVKDAQFGLMMPGKPKVGDKFYQEVAPKVAMDRAEIVSLEEKIETPAGKYEKCLHVKETTPLEKGGSQKVYAPGVGLVKDDEFLLEKVEQPKK